MEMDIVFKPELIPSRLRLGWIWFEYELNESGLDLNIQFILIWTLNWLTGIWIRIDFDKWSGT